MANAIEYKSASFHVTEGKGLRDEDEQALQQLGDEGWEIRSDSPATGNELGPRRLQSTTDHESAGERVAVSLRASLYRAARLLGACF
jgi:hypothetical protein